MKTFNNHFLFSHLYLDELIKSKKGVEEAKKLISSLRGWHGGWDDSSLESILATVVEPTLVSLDFNFARFSSSDHILQLTSSGAAALDSPLALCYVVKLAEDEDSLESTVKGRHYAANLVHVLQDEDLKWGILTDGEHWRLYHAEELAPYETYFAVDLGKVFSDGGNSEHAGYLFHEFFKKEAFLEDDKGECELDRHQERSEDTTEGIEEHLSGCIEEVMRDLCQGFVELDGREQYTETQRDEIFSDATILLYRMLFILYAEARGLLPIGDPAYDPKSLTSLVDQSIDYTQESGMTDPEGVTLWQRLSDLSAWVSSGEEQYHIPSYNGNLFDDEDKPYIHDFKIADKYLAPALFSLGTIENKTEKGYRRIDYRDLAVRHLGSIYEGLLEYKLFIAQEKKVRRSDGKGGYSFPGLAEIKLKKGEEVNVIDIDEVYFAHNAGERKATGAYYTPEYIVDYIVENTVWRGLEERRESLEGKLPEWISEVETSPPGERSRLQKTVDQQLVDFVEEEVLAFNVCDPAMGSGHFLVNAAHQIANFIVETLNLTEWENNEISSDPVYWRRRVVKSCIYGVDLNELAVELAKLSLWLTAIERGKPLGFLDHHLRQGNSLTGARLDDLTKLRYTPTAKEKKSKESGQMTFYDAAPEFSRMFTELQEKLDRISSMVAEKPEEVKAQEVAYQEIREGLKPLRDMADAIVARHFGVGVDDSAIQKALHDGNDPIFDQIAMISKEHRFFHWDLEFFEVFIIGNQAQEDSDNGFDAVIGNPPYSASIPGELRNYFETKFTATGSGYKNLALHFIELSKSITKLNFGFIVPKSITYSEGWNSGVDILWPFLVSVVDVSKAWKDVLLEMVVVITSFIEKRATYESGVYFQSSIEIRTEIDKEKWKPYDVVLTGVSHDARSAAEHIWENAEKLGHITNNYRGEGIQSKCRSQGDFQVIRGKDIERYSVKTSTYVEETDISTDIINKYNKKRIVAQNIVAHVTKPINHIKIIASIGDKKAIPLDTVNNIEIINSDWSNHSLVSLLNSRLVSWYVYNFVFNNAIRTMHFDRAYTDKIPLPEIESILSEEERKTQTNNYFEDIEHAIVNSSRWKLQILDNISNEILRELLGSLSKYISNKNEKITKLNSEIDVFNYLNKNQQPILFKEVFNINNLEPRSNDIKIGEVHHDIDNVKIEKSDIGWAIFLELKFRDQMSGWREWAKEDGGHLIKRRWFKAYELNLDDDKGYYYHFALNNREYFKNISSIPAGYTRTTFEKLKEMEIPLFENLDIDELIDKSRELSDLEIQADMAEYYIDQIVYKLYRLSENEISEIDTLA